MEKSPDIELLVQCYHDVYKQKKFMSGYSSQTKTKIEAILEDIAISVLASALFNFRVKDLDTDKTV